MLTEHTLFFTGGGTAGHVTPNLPLIQRCQQLGAQIIYIGTRTGIEKTIVERAHIPYRAIHSGKLHRHLTFKTLLTPFRVLRGIFQSVQLVRQYRPSLIFSKGGYVALPIVFAGFLYRVPIIIHESDKTLGLSNRLCAPFAEKICLSFPPDPHFEKLSSTIKNKYIVTGTPIRPELSLGNADKGRNFCHFSRDLPILMVIGGGLGAHRLNQLIRQSLPELLKKYQVIHCCGQGKLAPQYADFRGYRQFEYIHEELGDLFACADLVVSRAGANAIFELITLKKPHILIPLATASRGDQIENAKFCEAYGYSTVLSEENLETEKLLMALETLYENRVQQQMRLATYTLSSSVEQITELICENLS